MTENNDKTKDLKFYSLKAISIATFIGGPLAAGYLIRENYLSLNKPDEGKKALLIAITITLAIISTIILIPEPIMDKVPNQLFPAIYTGITYYIVEKNQGNILNQHEKNGYDFNSAWEAAGIGVISMLILLGGIVGALYLTSDGVSNEKYDREMTIFLNNETETLVFYDHLNTESNKLLLLELNNTTIPKWKENIEIVKKTSKIEGLPDELVQQNKELLKYSELRLKAFRLFQKVLREDTAKYNQEIEELHRKIDEQIEILN